MIAHTGNNASVGGIATYTGVERNRRMAVLEDCRAVGGNKCNNATSIHVAGANGACRAKVLDGGIFRIPYRSAELFRYSALVEGQRMAVTIEDTLEWVIFVCSYHLTDSDVGLQNSIGATVIFHGIYEFLPAITTPKHHKGLAVDEHG